MTSTAREVAYIRSVSQGQSDQVRQAERLADLELSPIADALKALLGMAQGVLESRTASSDEKALAERLLDAHGDPEDVWTISEVVR